MAQHNPEVGAPELERFLLGEPVRRIEAGPEARARLRELLSEPRSDAVLGPQPDETRGWRTMVLWRLCRATALVKGLCSSEESMEVATEVEPCPWTVPWRSFLTPAQQQAIRRGRAARLMILHEGSAGPNDPAAPQEARVGRGRGAAPIAPEYRGLPLLPPPADAPGKALERWCEAAEIIAADLGMFGHAKAREVVGAFVEPGAAAYNDIDQYDVMSFEDLLLDEALNMLLDSGEQPTITHLRESYGFARKEAVALLRLAKTQVTQRTSGTVEEKRALQEARLESIIARSKETMNVADEMRALKELAKIQGLTRTSPEDRVADIFAVVKAVSKRQDHEMLDERTYRMLDGRAVGTEDVEPIEVHALPSPAREDEELEDVDDAEALAEYDRENQLR